ncbi:MAG: hypothetical protein QOI41_6550 [Myxococcales bacterium]|jgi:hypothetical protein|nr:hypothetical protein [Myxococcales bacterium]
MRRAGSIAPVALLLCGCTVTTAPVPRPVVLATESTGTLVVSWTIDDHADADACVRAAATSVHIALTTTAGADAGTYTPDCATFSMAIQLAPETYAGSALLVDALGRPRTSVVMLQSFTILGGDVITTPIDFAAQTFTPN